VDEVEFGRYRLLGLIGEGAMGQVFRARDTLIPRDVAIKVLAGELATQPGYRERFRREAFTAAQLTEPHIIPIYDTGDIDGRLYLVMPIIDGIDMARLLHRDGPMSSQLVVRVIDQLASALDAAHAQGLVHRDVKPSNTLITGTLGREFAYLIDFGIAHDSAATKLTRTGSILGTLAYMAPERFTTGKADARGDIYALGCVLHECLTGSHPFPGNSMEQQVAGHLTADPPRPSRQRPGIPTGFDDIIARSMAKNPDDRYQRAHELAVAAERVLAEAVLATRPEPAPAAEPINFRQPANPDWAPPRARPEPPILDAQAQLPTQPAGPHPPMVPPGAPESPRRRTIVLAFAILAIGVAICAVGYLFAIGFLFTIGEVVIIVAIAVALYAAISRVRGIPDRD
jgi:serine/threonine protein kinase